MNSEKLNYINQKKWFQVLKSQYISLFKKAEVLKENKKTEGLNMDTEYPLLYKFTVSLLERLKKKFT